MIALTRIAHAEREESSLAQQKTLKWTQSHLQSIEISSSVRQPSIGFCCITINLVSNTTTGQYNSVAYIP